MTRKIMIIRPAPSIEPVPQAQVDCVLSTFGRLQERRWKSFGIPRKFTPSAHSMKKAATSGYTIWERIAQKLFASVSNVPAYIQFVFKQDITSDPTIFPNVLLSDKFLSAYAEQEESLVEEIYARWESEKSYFINACNNMHTMMAGGMTKPQSRKFVLWDTKSSPLSPMFIWSQAYQINDRKLCEHVRDAALFQFKLHPDVYMDLLKDHKIIKELEQISKELSYE